MQDYAKCLRYIASFNSFFVILFLNFTLLYWFCQISKWIHHRYTCIPHPEPTSLLPPHTIPLGRPSAPAPSIQYRASNLDWWLVPYMILYVFQCHSPKSSHPLPLPQSPKDCCPSTDEWIRKLWYIYTMESTLLTCPLHWRKHNCYSTSGNNLFLLRAHKVLWFPSVLIHSMFFNLQQ